MIHLHKICKTFGSPPKKVEALKEISLQVKKGDSIVIRGPSGSGKTTLLLSIGGMLQPSAGSIKIDGKDIYMMSEKDRTRFRAFNIGFVFQMFYLIPYLNVFENIMLSAGMAINGNKQGKALELTERLGLAERAWHKPAELSAGEQQRVALGRALIHQPKIILADEPTGNLDPENSSEVIKILQDYHQNGGTVIIVTHGRDADQFANRIICLDKGEIR